MQLPKYPLNAKVYTWSMGLKYRHCDACGQPVYSDDDWEDPERIELEIKEQTVEGYTVRFNVRECEDGVFYRLSHEHWDVKEDTIYPTEAEARAAAEAYIQESREAR